MKYHETPLQVRFYEVDAYGVVWHGHYVGWFEAGRNDLTQRYQMGPLQLKERHLLAPVVDLNCQFKLPATFDRSLIIQTTMERTEVAKLIFTIGSLIKKTGRSWPRAPQRMSSPILKEIFFTELLRRCSRKLKRCKSIWKCRLVLID